MTEIITHLHSLFNGLFVTLFLMIASLTIGLLVAMSMVIVNQLGAPFIKKIISAWVFFITGTPLLVQMFLIYFGTGQYALIRGSFLWVFLQQPMCCAVLALSINTSCYTFVLLNGAIASIPKNEIEACEAIGMSSWLALRHVILPRALRIFLPAYSNEVMMILKSTSLVSTITILDLMGVTQELISSTYATIEFYAAAALIYLILAGSITFFFRKIFSVTKISLI